MASTGMTPGSDHESSASYQTTVTILSETTEEPTTTLRYLWTTESSSKTVPSSIATSSVPVSETSTTSGRTTTYAPGVPLAAIIVPIVVVIFIIAVVVLVIFLIRRRRRLLEAQRRNRPPMPMLEEVDRTRRSEVGGPGCEIWLDSISYRNNESRLNDYTDPPEVHQVDQQREESTYVVRDDLNQTSAIADTYGVLTSGVSTLGRTLEPAKTENVYQNSGSTGRIKDDAYYVNASRRSEIESVISDDDDAGDENVGTHLPRQTTSGDGVTSPRSQNKFQDTAISGISSKEDSTSPNKGTRTNAIVEMTPDNQSGLRKHVCSIFPSSAGDIEERKES